MVDEPTNRRLDADRKIGGRLRREQYLQDYGHRSVSGDGVRLGCVLARCRGTISTAGAPAALQNSQRFPRQQGGALAGDTGQCEKGITRNGDARVTETMFLSISAFDRMFGSVWIQIPPMSGERPHALLSPCQQYNLK